MPFIACKLPSGLKIDHDGETIILLGANIGENLANASLNGSPADNASRTSGYGVSQVTDKQAEAFKNWADGVTYVNGVPGDGKLRNPFPALENGSILGPFKTREEANKECAAMAGLVKTGFEGLDPAAEGVETAEEEPAKTGKK